MSPWKNDGGLEMSSGVDLAGLATEVDSVLRGEGETAERVDRALGCIAAAFDARTATIHRSGDSDDGFLYLIAWRGIPEKVVEITRKIPLGKGMAGLCAERREPVTVCNLQTDTSGQARPGARQTQVGGGIVVPVLDDESGRVIGTLGVGKSDEHDFTDKELAALKACARNLTRVLREDP